MELSSFTTLTYLSKGKANRVLIYKSMQVSTAVGNLGPIQRDPRGEIMEAGLGTKGPRDGACGKRGI
jgi:hypothetical protein